MSDLWIPEHLEPTSLNRRPLSTHDRGCDVENHAEHKDSICATCGCCWGCEFDCCSEYTCPNTDCGCSMKEKENS